MRYTLLCGSLLLPSLVACGAEPSNAEKLGQSTSAVQGGTTDTKAAHNFAVGLVNRYGGICSGTLIAPNLVLTARHCVVPPSGSEGVTCADKFSRNVPANALFVTTDSALERSSNFYRVEEVTTPTESSYCGNDIALVRLAENVPASEATPVTPVVRFSIADRTILGDKVTVLGYGQSAPNAEDSAGVRRIRQNIAIECIPGDKTKKCTGFYAGVLQSDREFLTEGWVCSGDSGGGAFDQASFASGKPYVLGALSRGPQTETECLAAIYSRTDSHSDLIIAAGVKAAAAGGYEAPAWVTGVEPSSATAEEPCSGDSCTQTDEPTAVPTGTATTTTTTTTAGCSAAPRSSKSSLSALALAAVGALVVARRRRSS